MLGARVQEGKWLVRREEVGGELADSERSWRRAHVELATEITVAS